MIMGRSPQPNSSSIDRQIVHQVRELARLGYTLVEIKEIHKFPLKVLRKIVDRKGPWNYELEVRDRK